MSGVLEPSWSPVSMQVLQALGRCVRTLTSEQIARGWFDGDSDAAEEVTGRLCKWNLIERHEVYAHPVIGISEPVFHWTPGDPKPGEENSEDDFASISALLNERWTEDIEPFDVFIATRIGVATVGGYAPKPPETDQWTHDIHVGEMLVNAIEDNGIEVVDGIVGEAALPKAGKDISRMKDPDMFHVDLNGTAEMVLEFAGAYPEKHLKEFHEHCAGGAYKKLKKDSPNRKHYLYGPGGTQYILL